MVASQLEAQVAPLFDHVAPLFDDFPVYHGEALALALVFQSTYHLWILWCAFPGMYAAEISDPSSMLS